VAERPLNTFSIVAHDAETQALGIAVQSKVVAVGSLAPFAKAGVGAVCVQSLANRPLGERILEVMEHRNEPAAAVEYALAEREQSADMLQIAAVTASGKAVTYTGQECIAWAGGIQGEHFVCQGNLLTGEGVLEAMAEAFAADGEFGARLIAALRSGQRAGGECRGQQSAALLIVRSGWGYDGGASDRYRDLRVDEHAEPIEELARVYEAHKQLLPLPPKQAYQI